MTRFQAIARTGWHRLCVIKKQLAFLALILTCASAFAADEIVIKFSHVVSASNNPKGIAAEAFAARVNKALAGRVRVEVFPNSALYDDVKVLEALILGDVQMAAPSLSKFEHFTRRYRVFDLPFMFSDIAAVERFQQSPTGQKLKQAMSNRGLLGLTYWHSGMKQLSANKPLLWPEDIRGLTFRIQTSKVLEQQYKLLGVTTRKTALKDLYPLLQAGVVDGQENTWSNIYTTGIYQVQDGVTETNHGVLDYLVVTSEQFWRSLPADIRGELERILNDITREHNAQSVQINQANRQRLLAAGTPIYRLSKAQRQRWVEAMKPVWDMFAEEIGAEVIEHAVASNR